MSDDELISRIERNLDLSATTVSTETGLQAAHFVARIADAETIEWALAGGLAMHLYGFERATKDVDFVAAAHLSLEIQKPLSFGGARYSVTIENRSIDVDWIVRRDKYQGFYVEALKDAARLPNGLRILTPEWLVILKYIAGRAKDELDLLFLLQQKNLVSRRRLKQNLLKAADSLLADVMYREIERRYISLAETAGRNGDENESYLPPDFTDYLEQVE